MVALGQVVIKKIVLLVLCIGIASCEKPLGITNVQLLAWTEHYAQSLLYISNNGTLKKVTGDIKKEPDINGISGTFNSLDDENAFKDAVKELYEASSFPALEIIFNLSQDAKHRSIYISLYKDGFCASLGDCLKTYVVYHVDDKDLINEPNYHYYATKLKGWYILKVED